MPRPVVNTHFVYDLADKLELRKKIASAVRTQLSIFFRLAGSVGITTASPRPRNDAVVTSP